MSLAGPRGARWAPLAVFVLVFAVRASHWAALEATPLSEWHLWLETDEHAYVEWSARLAAGNWLDVPPYRPVVSWQALYGSPEVWEGRFVRNAYSLGPLYGYGLALLRRLFGPPVVPARILQLFLACLTASLVAAAVSKLLGRGSTAGPAAAGGAVAGALYGVYAPLVFHDGFLYRDGPFTHLSTLLLVIPVLSPKPARAGLSLAAGFLGGLAILMKQTAAPLAVLSGLLLSSRRGVGGVRAGLRALLPFGVGLSLPLLALAARNVPAGVSPFTLDSRQAMTFVWANARGANVMGMPDGNPFTLLDGTNGSTWKTASRVLRTYEGRWGELLALQVRKLLTFFEGFEVPDNASFSFFRERLPVLAALPVFGWLLGPGLVGLCAAWRRRIVSRGEKALLVTGLVVPLASCLVAMPLSRYRVAVAGPLAIGCGLGAGLLLEGWRRPGGKRPLVSCVGAALALSGLSLLPLSGPSHPHRYPDTIVYATLLEARVSPEAGAAEIERYVREGSDDKYREMGLREVRAWLQGDRFNARVAPEGVAPAGKRVSDQRGPR